MSSLKPFALRMPSAPSLSHRDRREESICDAAFANFRPMIINGRKSDTFFRSATIANSPTGRSAYVAQCAEENGIVALFDLTGNISQFQDMRVFSCDPGNGGDSRFYHKVFIECLRKYIERPLIPVLFCCEAGKYRTGFVSILLEALSGTEIGLIEQDFLQSYVNNNGVSRDSDSYRQLRNLAFEPIVEQLQAGCGALRLSTCARNYFSLAGLTSHEIDRLEWLLRA